MWFHPATGQERGEEGGREDRAADLDDFGKS